MAERAQRLSLFEPRIVRRAVWDAVTKLDPRTLMRNPVMFVVEVVAAVTTILFVRDLLGSGGNPVFVGHIAAWLWFTVLFANFADAVAEGRGKAQADSLRRAKRATMAKRLRQTGRRDYEVVPGTSLRQGDVVIVEAGDIIPGDGDVIEGIASVDESAITGESAPVIRESGGDRSAVTGGTRVLSDWIKVKISSNPGETFMDRMIALVEGSQRQKTPNEMALTILLVGLTIVFLLATSTLECFALYAGGPVSVVILTALFVTLIPTTIGGLLSAIGIAGMDRLVRYNVLAMSGRAVEAAGDVDTLLLDKTGTITLGNLTALRQLALRRTAERVDEQMQTYMQAHAIPGPWPVGERLLVCVSSSRHSPSLVRAARRMADRRHAEWLAVYVETPRHHRLSAADRDRLAQTLRLAEQLGGEVVTIPGQDVAEDLIRYAQSHHVTGVIIGKSLRSRWSELWRGSVVYDIIRQSGNIDVYVINEAEESPQRTPTSPVLQRPAIHTYFLSVGAVCLAGVTAKVVQSFLALPNLSMVFLIAVLFSAVTWGLGPSILASILSLLVYDFFFVDPVHTFTVTNPQDILALIIFLIVAVLTSNLAARVRNQAEAAKHRAARTAALYALSRQIAAAAGLDDVLRAIVTQVAHILGVKAVVLLPEADQLVLKSGHPADIQLTAAERAAATWAWQHNQPAGRGADTLPGGEWFYLPLRTAQSTVGVLGLQFETPETVLSPDQRRLLEALAGQAAVAVERTRLVREMEQTRLLTETERLRDALLATISHDLRTPLVSIIGAVSSLLTYEATYDESARRELLVTIQEEAERLNRFVGNLLDMLRLESGALEPKRQWVEIGDVIGTALSRLTHTLNRHQLVVEVDVSSEPA